MSSGISSKIVVKSAFDKNIGFLSNDSLCYVTIDGKDWKSVTHYLSAKKYEIATNKTSHDTEDEVICSIKKSSSSHIAKSIATNNLSSDYSSNIPGTVTKIGDCVVPNYNLSRWNKVYLEILEKALRAKFSNPNLLKKLCETGTTEIEYIDGKEIGDIIMKIRNEKILSPSKIQTISPDEPEKRDLTTDRLTDEESELVLSLIRYSLMLRDDEGQITLFPEMVEDVIYNFYPNLTIFTYLKINTLVGNSISNRKNFNTIFQSIKDEFIEADPSQKYNDDCSLKIAIFIQWIRLESCPSDIDAIFGKLTQPFSITLPPRQHSYRKVTAPKPIKTITSDDDIQYNEKLMNVLHHLKILNLIQSKKNIDRDDVKFLFEKLYGCKLVHTHSTTPLFIGNLIDVEVSSSALALLNDGLSLILSSSIPTEVETSKIIQTIKDVLSLITTELKINWTQDKLIIFCHLFVNKYPQEQLTDYISILGKKFKSYENNLQKGLQRYSFTSLYELFTSVNVDVRLPLIFGVHYLSKNTNTVALFSSVLKEDVKDDTVTNFIKSIEHLIEDDLILHDKLNSMDINKQKIFIESFEKLSDERKKKYLQKIGVSLIIKNE